MEHSLVLEGKKYISAKRAAEITGYARDYVGQLCRAGKIDAKLLGRNWYVAETSVTKRRKYMIPEELRHMVGASTDVSAPASSKEDVLSKLSIAYNRGEKEYTPLIPNLEKLVNDVDNDSSESAEIPEDESFQEHPKDNDIHIEEPTKKARHIVNLKILSEQDKHTIEDQSGAEVTGEEEEAEVVQKAFNFRFLPLALVGVLFLFFTVSFSLDRETHYAKQKDKAQLTTSFTLRSDIVGAIGGMTSSIYTVVENFGKNLSL